MAIVARANKNLEVTEKELSQKGKVKVYGVDLANPGEHLAMELADVNIRVNAVSPAVVVTPIYGSFIEKDKIVFVQKFIRHNFKYPLYKYRFLVKSYR
ncbi:hypothetical protein [Chitinophaga tropicalis]|uniref:hypothetical protein n=1 Tax=Chitinophaga tropicalis TaxID=2683588 RepID=UPI0018DF0D56|nr:hypothetical protein [Chitinophaga tropicalis]